MELLTTLCKRICDCLDITLEELGDSLDCSENNCDEFQQSDGYKEWMIIAAIQMCFVLANSILMEAGYKWDYWFSCVALCIILCYVIVMPLIIVKGSYGKGHIYKIKPSKCAMLTNIIIAIVVLWWCDPSIVRIIKTKVIDGYLVGLIGAISILIVVAIYYMIEIMKSKRER